MQIFREKIEIFVIFWANGLHIRKKNSIFVGFLWVIGSQIEQIKQIAMDITVHELSELNEKRWTKQVHE